MARSDVPYRREGENSWNELVRQINEMAEECGTDTIEEVDECHKLSKADIEEAQAALSDACADNEFSEVPDKWELYIIQELEDAVAAGACCCEDYFENGDPCYWLGEGPPPDCLNEEHEGTEEDPYPSAGNITSVGLWDRGFDWRPTVMGGGEADLTTIECKDNEGNVTHTIENRSGGYGWAGRQYSTWEAYVWWDEFEGKPESATYSGPIVDGYIQLPGYPVATQPTCANPSYGSGWKGGTENDSWVWRDGYVISTDVKNPNPNPMPAGIGMDTWFPLERNGVPPNRETEAAWEERVASFFNNYELEVEIETADNTYSNTFNATFNEQAFIDLGSPQVIFEDQEALLYDFDYEGEINSWIKGVLEGLGLHWVEGIKTALDAGDAGLTGPSVGVVFRCD